MLILDMAAVIYLRHNKNGGEEFPKQVLIPSLRPQPVPVQLSHITHCVVAHVHQFMPAVEKT